ncbi:CBS domain-containing protein [Bacillus sp. E214]|uniref:CBS domain-containing protein n=1 Tax=Bacillus sp. E214 TaxID=2587156 RepID=UPI0011DF7526|nr:CBS domain-containing protein [Bacillus sp. E214]
MFVKNIMISKYHCHTVSYNDTLQEVFSVLDEHQIEGVPVLKGNKYIGTITRYRVYKAAFLSELPRDIFLKETKAESIAEVNKTLKEDEIYENIFLDLKEIPLLAVVDDYEYFHGIVTRYDIIEQFQSTFGVHVPGVRIALTTVETKGRIARLTEIARQYQQQIISLVTFDETDKLLRRIVIKVVKAPNVDKFIRKLEESGFRVLHIDEKVLHIDKK